LLAALSPAEQEQILPSIDQIKLKLRELLHKPGETIDYVYFPGDGFCSLVTVLEDGGMVEVATIGREGMVGVDASLANNGRPSGATLVQGEINLCYRMTASAFRRHMQKSAEFSLLINRFTHALMGVIMQSTACNAVHSIEQRLARWLLMAQDRMAADEFPLTQEFAAMMLGATRPTVTVVAGVLQKAGLIEYHRGQVRVLNRRKLEEASCECYKASTIMLASVTARR